MRKLAKYQTITLKISNKNMKQQNETHLLSVSMNNLKNRVDPLRLKV